MRHRQSPSKSPDAARERALEKAQEREQAALDNVREGYGHPPKEREVGRHPPPLSPIEQRDRDAEGPSGTR